MKTISRVFSFALLLATAASPVFAADTAFDGVGGPVPQLTDGGAGPVLQMTDGGGGPVPQHTSILAEGGPVPYPTVEGKPCSSPTSAPQVRGLAWRQTDGGPGPVPQVADGAGGPIPQHGPILAEGSPTPWPSRA